MNIVLEQPILHMVCREDAYLKNSVEWELVRGDVKGLSWNEIIMSSCPLSTLNEALLRAICNRVHKRTIGVRTENKSWCDDQCILGHRAKQKAYRV